MPLPLILKPHPALQPYILHYVYTDLGLPDQWTNADMAPVGYSALTIPMRGKHVQVKIEEQESRCPVIFNGQVTQFKKVLLYDQTKHFFVIFKPHGAYSLLSLRQSECTDRIIYISDLLGTVGKEWEQILADQSSAEEMKLAVEQFFLKRTEHPKKTRINERLIYVNEQIRLQSHKSHLIKRICREERISINTLERQMKEVIGISPKQFHRIIRFNAVLQYIQRQPGKCHWAQVAYEFGYYDQTHFIKEFKQFYGKTPTSYSTNDWLLSSIAQS